MRAAQLVRLVGIERGVDAAEHHDRPGLAGGPADLVAPQGVAGMDADADDVPAVDGAEIERFERFVGDDRVAERARRRGGDDEQPARRDDTDTERDVAGIDEADDHMGLDVILNLCQVDVKSPA